MKRLLLLVPLAGCPKGGDAKGPAPGEVYAGIFEPQRQWTYDVVDGDDQYQISCQVTDQRDLPDGRLSIIACDGTIGEGMQEAIAGTWAADARGLWYLPDVIYDDLADATGMPKDAMTGPRMLLAARPVAGTQEYDGGQYTVTVENTAEGWCTVGDAPGTPTSWSRLCFAEGGVTSGRLGWDEDPREVSFQEAPE